MPMPPRIDEAIDSTKSSKSSCCLAEAAQQGIRPKQLAEATSHRFREHFNSHEIKRI